MSSGNSDENKTRRKFNQRNVLALKNSQPTVYLRLGIAFCNDYASDYASMNDHQMKNSTNRGLARYVRDHVINRKAPLVGSSSVLQKYSNGKMCCIYGCTKRGGQDRGVFFYSLFPVVHNQGDKTQEILLSGVRHG